MTDMGMAMASERLMVESITAHLRGEFGKDCTFALEVPSHGRARTDVAIVNDDQLVAIEVKLTQWRRVLGQAILNRFCADLSYIAVPHKRVTDLLLSEASSYGIGVIAVSDAGVEISLEAGLARPIEGLRAAMVDHIIKRGGM